jgi:hypothetical protein
MQQCYCHGTQKRRVRKEEEVGGQEEVRQRLNERNLSAPSAKYFNVCEDVGWMIPLRLPQAHGCKRVAG